MVRIVVLALAVFASACNPGAKEARVLAASCTGGDAVACDTLGVKAQRGDHILRDWRRAGRLYQQACDGSEGDGCVRLARLHVNKDGADHGVPLDSAHAASLLERGCGMGTMPGCVDLGDMYVQKDSVEIDEDTGKPKVAKGPRQDVPRAIALYEQACDGADMRGCDRLGIVHREGTGTAPDAVRAAALFGQSCDGGYQMGCAHLGEALVEGAGLDADPARAATLFEKACETEKRGCFDFAGLLEHGTGVTQDGKRAVDLYRKACERRDGDDGSSPTIPEACYRAGNMYANGAGVERNLGRASLYFRMACRQGYQEACRRQGG